MESIKFCSFNVNGLGNRPKREKIFSWLKQNNFNICFLQELHCTLDSKETWKKQWGHELYLSGNSSNSKGIGILINLNSTYEISKYEELIPGRLQIMKVKLQDSTITLINIYGPNTDDITFFWEGRKRQLWKITLKPSYWQVILTQYLILN